jgi:hypothetical protein
MADRSTTDSTAPHTSRLLELLRRAGREEGGTVGFGRARQPAARRPPLVLVAALPDAGAVLLTAAREARADAALVPITSGSPVPAGLAAADGWPVAVRPEPASAVSPAELDAWLAAGADAVALRPQAALAACFSPRRHGLFAHLDRRLEPEALRGAAALPVDGFILEPGSVEGRLSGDDLLWIMLATSIVRGPAVLLSPQLIAEDLEALVAAGLAGIALTFPAGSTPATVQGKLSELRTALDELDPHLRQEGRDRAGSAPVVLPFRVSQE